MTFVRVLLPALLAAVCIGQPAAAQFGDPGNRSGRWEGYGGLRETLSESVNFQGGSAIDVDDDLGLALGLGYNVNEHLLIGGELSWGSPDYDGVIASADTPGSTATLSGQFDALSLSANVTWNIIKGPLTPFVTGTLGYTWIDTNIIDGPPVTGCWWDPWWGYICDTFVDTKTEESFSYGLGAGIRWDFFDGGFARVSYEERWLDLDGASGTPSFGGVNVNIGSRF